MVVILKICRHFEIFGELTYFYKRASPEEHFTPKAFKEDMCLLIHSKITILPYGGHLENVRHFEFFRWLMGFLFS